MKEEEEMSIKEQGVFVRQKGPQSQGIEYGPDIGSVINVQGNGIIQQMQQQLDSLQTQLNDLACGVGVLLTDFVTQAEITAGDVTAGFILAMDEAVAQSKSLVIPPGVWLISSVEIPVQLDIVCQPGANVQAVGGAGPIFIDTQTGSLKRLRIDGGTWNNCDYVLQRTNTSSLIESIFRDCFFEANIACFELESSIQTLWESCRFNGAGIGVHLLPTTQSNINTFRNCKFILMTALGILSDGNGGAGTNTALSVVNCSFEQMANGAIRLTSGNSDVDIFDCYFEGNGANNVNDIIVDTDGGGQNREIKISNCAMPNGAGAQTVQRIELRGTSVAAITGNSIDLNVGQNAIRYAVANVFVSEFFGNYLEAAGGGTYESRLFDDFSTNDPHWSAEISAFASDATARMFWRGIFQANILRPFRISAIEIALRTVFSGELIQVDTSGGAFQLNIWTGAGQNDVIAFKKVVANANPLTIVPLTVGQTIEGNPNLVLSAAALETVVMVLDVVTNNWLIVTQQ